MKRTILITILILLAPMVCTALDLDVTTTSEIMNPSDRDTTRVIVKRVLEDDSVAICDLYDEDTLVALGRVFTLTDTGTNDMIPFVLLDSEKALVNGQKPAEWWDAKTARLYMKSKQATAEDGNAVADDPYIISDSATIAEIISQLADMESK